MTTINTDKQDALTYEEASRLLVYEPATGLLRWRIGRPGASAGSIVGTVKKDGYRVVVVNGREYEAHRLIWLLTAGEWPSGLLDHRDGNRDNNRFTNLRIATTQQNGGNRRRAVNNQSGCTGVHWRADRGKWRVAIEVDGQERHLGYFTNLRAACRRYCQEALRIFGKFSNCQEEWAA